MGRIGGMLKPIRRHTPKCPHRSKGNDYLKCSCPLWAYGTIEGQRIRESLKTRDLQRGHRKIADMITGDRKKPSVALTEAANQYLSNHADLRIESLRKYRRNLDLFLRFSKDRGVVKLDDVTPELIDAFRDSREIELITWSKELQFLRGFFGHCNARGWIVGNPAEICRSPKVEEKAKIPYTKEEFISMLAACDSFGQGSYERLRARAMLLVLRYTAFRISDVAMLKRSSLRAGNDQSYLHVRTIKNGVDVPSLIPPEVVQALEALPDPRSAGLNPEYFFWSGHGSLRSLVRSVDRTLRKVFLKSGVTGAHTHRFRHSLSTELLELGASFEDVATILGSSPGIIRKHYAQWSTKRQERSDSLRQTVWTSGKDTIETQTKKVSAIC